PHGTRAGYRSFRGPSDQGRRLLNYSHALGRLYRWLTRWALDVGGTGDNDRRYFRRDGADRYQAFVVIYLGQSHRLHDLRCRTRYRAGALRRHLLRRAPHFGTDSTVFGRGSHRKAIWHFLAAAFGLFALHRAGDCHLVLHPGHEPGRHSTFLGLYGQDYAAAGRRE